MLNILEVIGLKNVHPNHGQDYLSDPQLEDSIVMNGSLPFGFSVFQVWTECHANIVIFTLKTAEASV